MEFTDVLRQVLLFLSFIATGTALVAAILWPYVRGKPWIVASLALFLTVQFYFRMLEASTRWLGIGRDWNLELVTMLMFLANLTGYVCLAIGLFQLRSLFLSSAWKEPGSDDYPMPTEAERTTWRAKGGTLLGPFRVNGRSTTALARNASLLLLVDDNVVLRARYDPPGTIFYALLATIAGGVVFAIMLASLGFAAAPGWLVWYFIILFIRRRKIALPLADADAIVVDANTSRIALRTHFHGRDRWFAVQMLASFPNAEAAIKDAYPKKTTEGSVDSPSPVLLFVLLGIIFAIMALIATMAVLSFSR